VKADIQVRASSIGDIAVVPGGTPDRALIAEGVEKVF
jgi:hypothetical protein